MKKALVTGISGQDGYYLSKLLVSKGYQVTGLTRKLENLNSFDEDLKKSFKIVVGEITNEELLTEIIAKENFDEIYNLASVATVASPWEDVNNLVNVVAGAPIKIFDIVKNKSPKTRIFQASSAEIYGDSMEFPQNEETLPRPKTPYAVSKLFVDQMAKLYRDSHKIFVCSGIMFNHESDRRGESFVTRKITKTLARIKNGEDIILELGNLEAKRDWGFAGDYVEAMHMMLQANEAKDFVIASGEMHSVKEFVEIAAGELGQEINWQGSGSDQIGKDQNGRVIVKVNPQFYRPLDVSSRQGDITKIKEELGWQPKTSFRELVSKMVKADLEKLI